MDIVANWPLFATAPIRVLGIRAPPRYAGLALSGAEMSAVHHDLADVTRATIDGVLGEAVDQLTAERRDVEGRVRAGDPHTQIFVAAREWRTDLVIIGATDRVRFVRDSSVASPAHPSLCFGLSPGGTAPGGEGIRSARL